MSNQSTIKTFTYKKEINMQVWQIDLSNVVNNSILLNEICDYRKSNPESKFSNVKSWHTSPFTHLLTDKFNDFISEILSQVDKLVGSGVTGYYQYDVDQLWVCIYNKGGYTVPHNHNNYPYSFVYYVEADENTSPLVIDGTSITPKPGLLVVFSGLAKHFVPELTNDSKRTIVAGNIIRYSQRFQKIDIKSNLLKSMMPLWEQQGW